MQAPVAWSGEQLVNTTTVGDQKNAAVMGLPGGGYIVTWDGTSNPATGDTSGYFQVFDASGNKVGTEQIYGDTGQHGNPQVAALEDGGFVITTRGFDVVGAWGIVARVYDASGVQVGSTIPVNSEPDPNSPGDQTLPKITTLYDGGFAIAYITTQSDGSQDLHVQRFDADGNKLGTEILVATDPDANFQDIAIDQTDDGHFAVSWSIWDAADTNVTMQVFDNSGVASTGIVPLTGAGHQSFHAVSSDGTGQFLVTYFDQTTTEVYGQLFAADGTLVEGEFPISDVMQNFGTAYYPEATGLPGGGYFVVWLEYGVNSAPTLVGQMLDAAGSKVGPETVIMTTGSNLNSIDEFNVAALADGRIALTIVGPIDTGADTDLTSVRSMILDPRGGIIDGTDAADVLLGSGDATADIITAKGDNDEVYGLDGDDTIYGNGGNDTLDGGLGADSMVGGAGNDDYVVDNVGDVVVEAVGSGTDRIVLEGIDFVLAAGLEVEELEMSGNVDTDVTGNEFSQLLLGDASNNKLMGLGGNDTLDGGTDFDYMEGGTGDDLYLVDMENEFVVEAFNEGTDTVQTKGVSFSLENWNNVENLILVGGGDLDGTGNGLANTITGNDNDNDIYGNAGNDTLIGGLGADTMYGGANNDTYEVDHISDIVSEQVGEGTDTVKAFIDYTLTDDVENLNLMGSVVSGTGNNLANTLKGNSAGNVLNGLGGNDTLDGQGGNDTMAGGTHDDTYIVGQVGDVVTELANAGSDTVIASLDYTLGANVENLTLAVGTYATGNGLANAITGNAGANTIDGKAGADTMTGLLGDDHYIVGDAGDVVIEVASGGFDTVIASVDHILGAFVEKLVLAAGTNATGNNLANEIVGNVGANVIDGKQGNDTMTGLAGDDTYVVTQAGDMVVEAASGGTDTVIAHINHVLAANVENVTLVAGSNATGNALANVLTGNAGNNKLDGQGGADTMSGGLGNDDYIVTDAGDVVVEDAASGIDTVHAAFDYALGNNLETLLLTSNAVKGTGNSAANTLIGNALANTLKGGAGDDTMDGGAGKDALEGGKGNDTYVLGGSKDKVTDNKGADDTITSTITRKLADFAGIENLKLEGTAHINGTGNATDNDLVGNAGKNQLKGEAGNDLIRGLAGADQLWGGGGADTFDFDAVSDIRKASSKRDIIKDFQHLNDKIDLSTIDANSLLAGDQAFKFKAAEGTAFTGVAGQLIWDQKDAAGTSSDRTLVSGDINGDGLADFTLELSGLVNLTKVDFIL
jgi:Ca2+-binding RTX toxin-like protein